MMRRMKNQKDVYLCLNYKKALTKFSLSENYESATYDEIYYHKIPILDFKQADEIYIALLAADHELLLIDQFSKSPVHKFRMPSAQNILVMSP